MLGKTLNTVKRRFTTARRIRVLRRQIRRIDAHYRPLVKAAMGDDLDRLEAEWQADTEFERHEILAIESLRLAATARRWDVEIPHASWFEDPRTGHSYLDSTRQAVVRREIKHAKRESIRWWVPVFGLLVAIIGVVITVYVQWDNLWPAREQTEQIPPTARPVAISSPDSTARTSSEPPLPAALPSNPQDTPPPAAVQASTSSSASTPTVYKPLAPSPVAGTEIAAGPTPVKKTPSAPAPQSAPLSIPTLSITIDPSADLSCASIGSGEWNDRHREFLQVRFPSLRDTFDDLIQRTAVAALVPDPAENIRRQALVYQAWRGWISESRRWVERAFGPTGRVDFESAAPSDAVIDVLRPEMPDRIEGGLVSELRIATGRMECLLAIEQTLKARAP
jgi:hypothetical protein